LKTPEVTAHKILDLEDTHNLAGFVTRAEKSKQGALPPMNVKPSIIGLARAMSLMDGAAYTGMAATIW
jgi:hypothetical protein